jgi:catechol 2,3-dioxygenase-like lactoylglutathione lyase family enzyme
VLTPSEWAVLDLYRHGLGRAAIAARLGISAYGARYHLRNIADKLGVPSTAELRHWPGFPAGSARRRRTMPVTTQEPSTTTASEPREGARSPAPLLGPLGQVSILTRSAEAFERWYRDVLGLPHVFTFGDLVFFDCGGTRLYAHAVPDEQWRPSSILYFLVPDIEAAHRELGARGIRFQGAPHMIYRDEATGTEEWMAFFDDPDGNVLAIMARTSPAEADEAAAE